MNFRYSQILIAFVFLEQLLCQSIPPFMRHINTSSAKQNTDVKILDKLNLTNSTISLGSFGSYEFDFSLANVQKDVVMHFESKFPILISVIFNKDLPSEPLVFPIEHQQSRGTESYISNLEFSKNILNFIYGERSSIELKNQNNRAIEVNLTIGYRERDLSAVVTAFAALIGIFVLIAITFCIAEYIRSLKTQNQNVPRIYPEIIPTPDIEITINTLNNEILTTEELNHHFQGVNYEKLKSSFPQTSCSICLEEMGPGISCHKLYCEHIFHTKCIQAWFKHQLPKYQACCPNCNQDMLQYSFVNYPKDFLL